jgi:hypothetical protein
MTLTMRVTKTVPRPEGVAHEEIVLHKAWVGPEDSPRGLEELACLLIEADLRSGRDYSAKETLEMESRMTVAMRTIFPAWRVAQPPSRHVLRARELARDMEPERTGELDRVQRADLERPGPGKIVETRSIYQRMGDNRQSRVSPPACRSQ